jgi:PPP family 3-phenylpropionic acid transporter
MASTASLPVQFILQPLHGLTIAALHLATMRLLAESIPPRISTTAFGIQASLGPGLAGALLTLAAGPLYGTFGAGAFWAMAALCAVALPATAKLTAEASAFAEEVRTALISAPPTERRRTAITAP